MDAQSVPWWIPAEAAAVGLSPKHEPWALRLADPGPWNQRSDVEARLGGVVDRR